jgi:DNA-binding transcriptional MocR family regulator
MHASPKPLLYQEVADRLTALVRQGTYPPGARIPSVRQTSEQQAVSISTVLQAYSLLESRGLIEARPQSGYYVRRQASASLPEPEMSASGRDPTLVSIHELTMMLLADSLNPALVQLGAALPNPQFMPLKKINRIMVDILRQNEVEAHQYLFPPGLESLRTQIAQRAALAGADLAPNEILITSGGVEAIDLCLHAVCRPGDIVATESPTYFGSLQTLEVQGLRALEIPTHPREGLSIEALAFALEHNPIRAVLVISNFNNPLGSLIPDEKKKELVELLRRYDVPLIENDVSGELYFGERRPLTCKAFDTAGSVMLCSSFSKDISPGLRVGWAAAGRYLSEATWLKSTISASSPTLPQMAVARFLEGGGYEQHLRRIRREYARNVELLSDAVVRHFPGDISLTRPSGGFVLWVRLPDSVDSLELYKVAHEAGITLAPGYVFSPTQQFPNFIRLNAAEFNYTTERALERLGGMIAEMAEAGD